MVRIRPTAPRFATALIIVFLFPAFVGAQDGRLKLPTIAAGAAAAADWATTYHALKNFRVRETNPLLRPLDHSPSSLVSLGAAIDVGAFSVWNVAVGRRNERVAAAGLWAMTAFRAFLAIHNFRNTQRAERR